MSEHKESTDAEEILAEFQQTHNPISDQPQSEIHTLESESQIKEIKDHTVSDHESVKQTTKTDELSKTQQEKIQDKHQTHDGNIIFIGLKSIMSYVTAVLTRLANHQTVTITARGKRITQAVDISQMIIKRMSSMEYVISDVRISSNYLKSQDGKQRNVSVIEIDITKK